MSKLVERYSMRQNNADDKVCLVTGVQRLREAISHYQHLQEDWGKYLPSLSDALTDKLNDLEAEVKQVLPLRLLLIGGSGVGKSTLLNRLAGEEVTRSSDLYRAHTSGFTVYAHQNGIDELRASLPPSLLDLLNLHATWITHQLQEMEHLWVIDSPDIDSIVTRHRELTVKLLAEVELPVVVTSPQKYRDTDCVNVLKLIDHRRPFLFVLNQLDTLFPEEREDVLLDCEMLLREEQFNRVVFVGMSAKKSEGEGILRLRKYLSHELDEHERTRIRRTYLGQRLAELAQPFTRLGQVKDLLAADVNSVNHLINELAHCLLVEGRHHDMQDRMTLILRKWSSKDQGLLTQVSLTYGASFWLKWSQSLDSRSDQIDTILQAHNQLTKLLQTSPFEERLREAEAAVRQLTTPRLSLIDDPRRPDLPRYWIEKLLSCSFLLSWIFATLTNMGWVMTCIIWFIFLVISTSVSLIRFLHQDCTRQPLSFALAKQEARRRLDLLHALQFDRWSWTRHLSTEQVKELSAQLLRLDRRVLALKMYLTAMMEEQLND